MTEDFNNRTALFLWGFAVVWLAMLVAMTWVTVRDGLFSQEDMRMMPLVLGVFWVGGVGLAVHVLSQPCIRVTVHARQYVRVTWLYPFKVVRKDFPKGLVGQAQVKQMKDSEGDPYFVASAAATGSEPLRFAESHQRQHCEAACVRFNSALFGAAPPHR